MIKLKILFLLLLSTLTFNLFSQTITIKTIENGIYGQSSSIAVPIQINDPEGKLAVNNVFKLYISDANGSFANAKQIGSYPGFYTTFINGIIPNNLPAGDYKVLIRYNGDKDASAASGSFTVAAKAAVLADIDANSNQIIFDNPKTFGVCKPERSTNFRFTNRSTTGAEVNLLVTNEQDLNQQSFNLTSSPATVNAELSHYTLFVKASLNGVIGTRAFFLINNIIKPGFNAPANNTVCLPTELLYDIETESSNGIQNNFPGYSYQINWGDGAVEDFTPNQIIAKNAQIQHTYTQSSCGKQIRINAIDYYNVYGIIYQVNSPFCGLVSVPISTQAKVLTKPENRFDLPTNVCINTPIVLNNISITGDNPSSNSTECRNTNNLYYWYVDDVLLTPQGVPLSYTLNHVFTTPGFHKIRLESESFSSCEAAPLEKTCFVQFTPKPAFTLSENVVCAGTTIKANNQSEIDLSELAQNKYLWEIIGPDTAHFANGTNSESKNADFHFTKSGVYFIKLSIISPCGLLFEEKKVVVNQSPTISANWQTNFCGKNQLITFDDSTSNPLKTIFTGSAETNADTYTWEVTGGTFSFKQGTGIHSKKPTILFEDFGTYTITITHKNNCGIQTINKTLTFNDAPTVFAGDDQKVCNSSDVILNGKITGAYKSLAWTGGNGTFLPSRNVLNATYSPSASERVAGEVNLKLSVVTESASPCDLVEDELKVVINPINKVTSPSKIQVCTGNELEYIPKALEGSTFSWTASSKGEVTGFPETGKGEISHQLTNSTDDDATVIYTITPSKDGCLGEPFTLTVTVSPQPKFTALASSPTICSGKESVIIFTASQKLKYIWTSTATGKIGGNSQQTTPVSVATINDVLMNEGDSTSTVTYTITPINASGCAGTPVVVKIAVSANQGFNLFSPDRTKGCSPLKIAFKNNTAGSANKYYWDFGDGQTLVTTDNNTVNHTYNSAVARTYTAKLRTETDCGSFTTEYIISISPSTVQPNLVVNGNEYEGCAPHTVKFYNSSKGATLFKYDFGDGTIIETNKSPEAISHTFTKGGTYVVKLTASNGCSDTTTTETIKVFPNAVTDFEADITSGCDSVTIKFTNKSTGAIAYLWDFGDGTVSTDTDPVHQFSNSKTSYSISLTSYSSFGCETTVQKADYIKMGGLVNVSFTVSPGNIIQYPNYRFSFLNNTKGSGYTYLWDFGDGTTSTLEDPQHNYPDTGMYKVTLAITNKSGCSSLAEQVVRITGTPGNLFIPNAFMPNSLTTEIRTFQAKGSGILDWHMRIFNKWGELIWETKALDEKGRPVEGWDGTMFGQPAPQGIYFWEVAAKFINGTEWAGMIFTEGTNPKKAGTLNLIR